MADSAAPRTKRRSILPTRANMSNSPGRFTILDRAITARARTFITGKPKPQLDFGLIGAGPGPAAAPHGPPRARPPEAPPWAIGGSGRHPLPHPAPPVGYSGMLA